MVPAKRVVFVCAANRVRSVAAEHLFRNLLKEIPLPHPIEVRSAGFPSSEFLKKAKEMRLLDGPRSKPFFGWPPDPGLIEALREWGIEVSSYRSRRFGEEDLRADLIVTLDEKLGREIRRIYPEAKEKVISLGELAGDEEDIADPVALHGPYDPPGRTPYDLGPEVFKPCIRKIEEKLRRALPEILRRLGIS